MGQRRFQCNDGFLSAFQSGWHAYKVTDGLDLPADARMVQASLICDGKVLEIILESAEWPEGEIGDFGPTTIFSNPGRLILEEKAGVIGDLAASMRDDHYAVLLEVIA